MCEVLSWCFLTVVFLFFLVVSINAQIQYSFGNLYTNRISNLLLCEPTRKRKKNPYKNFSVSRNQKRRLNQQSSNLSKMVCLISMLSIDVHVSQWVLLFGKLCLWKFYQLGHGIRIKVLDEQYKTNKEKQSPFPSTIQYTQQHYQV